jgi:hypothetical protein
MNHIDGNSSAGFRNPRPPRRRLLLGVVLVALCFAYPAYKLFYWHADYQNQGITSEFVIALVLVTAASLAVATGEALTRLVSGSLSAVVLALVAGPIALVVVERLLDALLTTQRDAITGIWQNTWSVTFAAQGPLVFKAALPAATLWFVSQVRTWRARQDDA